MKVLLGNITFNNFTKKELKMFKEGTEKKALIHEVKETKVFTSKKEAYQEVDNTHHDAWIIPELFEGEIVYEY